MVKITIKIGYKYPLIFPYVFKTLQLF